MDAGVTIKPVTSLVASDYARHAVANGQSATPTELPQAQAVTAASNSTPTQNTKTQREAPVESNVSRSYVIDPQSHEVIYRVMDVRTRQILWQVPDEALLRQRAYTRTAANQPSASTPQKDLTK
jgi:hypothetical protein